jgi:hypothetical protein
MVVAILMGGLSILALVYVVILGRSAIRRGQFLPTVEGVALGAVTNFFDTLGIGSFAPTTAWIRLRRLVPDSFIPTTLNAGHGLPTLVGSGLCRVLSGSPWSSPPPRSSPQILSLCPAAARL